MNTAHVHRFRDRVAVYLADGKTVYLTEKEARSLSAFLLEAAKDVKRRKFTDSQFGTHYVPLSSPLDPHKIEHVAAVGKRRAANV